MKKQCVGKLDPPRPLGFYSFSLRFTATRWMALVVTFWCWKPAKIIRSCVKQVQQVVSERWVSLAMAIAN